MTAFVAVLLTETGSPVQVRMHADDEMVLRSALASLHVGADRVVSITPEEATT